MKNIEFIIQRATLVILVLTVFAAPLSSMEIVRALGIPATPVTPPTTLPITVPVITATPTVTPTPTSIPIPTATPTIKVIPTVKPTVIPVKTFKVQGRVTSQYRFQKSRSMENIIIEAASYKTGVKLQTKTNKNGNYSFSLEKGLYRIKPVSNNVRFTPPWRTINVTRNINNLDFKAI